MINLGVMTFSYRGQFIHLSPTELIRGSTHYSFSLTSQYERVKLEGVVQHTPTGFTLGSFGSLVRPHAKIYGQVHTSYEWSAQDDLVDVELYEGQQALPSFVFTVKRPYEQLVQSLGIRLIKDDYIGELRLTLPQSELRVFRLKYRNAQVGDPWGTPQELQVTGSELSLPMSKQPQALCVVRSGKLISAYWLTNTRRINDQEDLNQLRKKLLGVVVEPHLDSIPYRISSYLTASLKPYIQPSLHALTSSAEPSDWVKLSLLYELQYLTTEAQNHGYQLLASRLQSLQSRVQIETLPQGAQELSPRSLLERLSPKLVLALELGYDDARRPQLLELSSEPWFERSLPFFKGASLLKIRLCAQLFRERNHDAEQLIQMLQTSGFSIEVLNELLQEEGSVGLATVLTGLNDLNPSCQRSMMTCVELRAVLQELNAGASLSLDPFSESPQWLSSQETRRQQLKKTYEDWLIDLHAQLNNPPTLPSCTVGTSEELYQVWATLELPAEYLVGRATPAVEELWDRFQELSARSEYIKRRFDEQLISDALTRLHACSSDLEGMARLSSWLKILYAQPSVDLSVMLRVYVELKNNDLLGTVEALATQGQTIAEALAELRAGLSALEEQALELVAEAPASLAIPVSLTTFKAQDVVQAVSRWVELTKLIEGYTTFCADMLGQDKKLNETLSNAIIEGRRVCQACGEPEELPRCVCGWPHYLISGLAERSAYQALSVEYYRRLKAHKTRLWLNLR